MLECPIELKLWIITSGIWTTRTNSYNIKGEASLDNHVLKCKYVHIKNRVFKKFLDWFQIHVDHVKLVVHVRLSDLISFAFMDVWILSTLSWLKT